MLQDEYIHISDVTVYGCAATHTGTRRCVWLASTPRHMPVVARDLAQWHTSSVVTSCPFTKAKSTVSSLLLPGDPPPWLVRPFISLLSVFTSVTARSASFQGISLVLGPRPSNCLSPNKASPSFVPHGAYRQASQSAHLLQLLAMFLSPSPRRHPFVRRFQPGAHTRASQARSHLLNQFHIDNFTYGALSLLRNLR